MYHARLSYYFLMYTTISVLCVVVLLTCGQNTEKKNLTMSLFIYKMCIWLLPMKKNVVLFGLLELKYFTCKSIFLI